MRKLAPVLILAMAGALGGCSTLSDTFGRLNPFSSSGPKAAELKPIAATAEVRVLWSAQIGKAGNYVFSPAAAGDAVFAAAADGSLARFENGKPVWRIKVGQPLSAGVGSDGQIVLVGTAKGDVLAFAAADGKSLWQAKVSSEVLAAPVVGDEGVAVKSGDNRIFLLDRKDGSRKWFYQRATPSLALRNAAAPVFADRYLFAGFPGGKLVALDLKNGAPLWEGTVALPKGSTELERVADIVSSPVFDVGQTCAVAYQGRVACFDLSQGGQLIWARDLSSVAGMAMDSRYLFVTDEKSNVLALGRSAGGSVWKQDKLLNRVVTAPVVRRGLVAVGDYKGIVHFLKRDDGAFAARVATDGSAIATPPQVVGAKFLVQTVAGGIYMIEAQ